MASGNINGTTNASGVQARVRWQQSGVDASARTSVVDVVLQVYNSGAVAQSGRGTWTVTVDGETFSFARIERSFYYAAGWVTIGSASKTVTHALDGTKSVPISASGGFDREEGQPYTSTTLSGTAALEALAPVGASAAACTPSLTANGANLSTVTISRASAAYRHTVRWYVDNSNQYTATGVETSASYAIPAAWLGGAQSVTGYVDVTTFSGSVQVGQTVTLSYTILAQQAPPAPTPTGPSAATCTQTVQINGANVCQVLIDRSSVGCTHTVTWRLGTYSHSETGVETNTSYAIPVSWLAAMPSSVSATGYVDVTTYFGGAQVGTTQTISFTAIVPDDVRPAVQNGWYTLSPVSDDGRTLSGQVYIRDHSRCKATFDTSKVAAPAGATLTGYSIMWAGVAVDGTGNWTTGVLTVAGEALVMVSVTDSRGRVTSATETITVYDYSPPRITVVAVERCGAGGTESETGGYLKLSAYAVFATVGGRNTGALLYRAKSGNGSWSNWDTMNAGGIVSGQTYTVILPNYPYTDAASAEFSAHDDMDLWTTAERTLAPGYVPGPGDLELRGFNMRDGGDGAAFGMRAAANWLKVAYSGGLDITQGALKIGAASMSAADITGLESLEERFGGDGGNFGTTSADTMTTPGVYYTASANASLPGNSPGLLAVLGAGTYILQLFMEQYAGYLYWRGSVDSGTSWTGWKYINTTAV